ncbi:MAG: hypothetical protein K8S62_14300 [Candidatus Sabulitectum sp.]|nr:hypothetical protein [Candidatus Sabulitectum sp.]
MLAVFLFILSNPMEDYSADPYRIFAQSDSILSSINSIEYSFAFSGTGALSNIIPEVQGTTSLGNTPGLRHPLMYHSFTTLIREGAIRDLEVPSSFIASAESVYYVDHNASVMYSADYNILTQDIFDFPPASIMMEYVIPDPFNDEILADSIAVLFPTESDGVPCHVFHVFYNNAHGTEAVWFLGMEDLLPRAVERIEYYGPTSMPGGQLLKISGLRLDCPLSAVPAIPDDFANLPWRSLLETGELAPGFFLSDKNGFARRSSDFNGRTLLLCFFSSWDTSSLSALGLLKSITDDYPDFVQAVGISIWEAADPWFRLNSLGINFPVLVFGEDAADDYNVHSVPAIFLISRDGIILFTSMNITDDTVSEIINFIEEESM